MPSKRAMQVAAFCRTLGYVLHPYQIAALDDMLKRATRVVPATPVEPSAPSKPSMHGFEESTPLNPQHTKVYYRKHCRWCGDWCMFTLGYRHTDRDWCCVDCNLPKHEVELQPWQF